MKRRIFAWVILAGFVLLLLNLIVFRVYWQLSMAVYLIIVIAFVLTKGKLVNTQNTDKLSNSDDVNDADVLNKDADYKNSTTDDAIDTNEDAENK